MSGLPLVDECDYYTEPTKDGKFIGKVRQFPNLRTRPEKNALDARDAIITATRDKLADLNAATDPHAGAAQPRQGVVG